MPYLDKTLRRQLAATIGKAREVAEAGAADSIRRLGVAEDAAPSYLTDADRALRRLLRAHARSLGDAWNGKTLGTTGHLMETAAFEHWHRMLFGRFLVERGLLVDPASGATIAREELAELAAERSLADEWAVVEEIAAPALPAVFKPGDPALALPLAPEYAKRLRDLVAALPDAVFTSDDALGWTYQFWRAAEKERVNRAGGKIGAAELPAVTQLFTEPYMVQFLLHNTLGAWWAGKRLAADPALAAEAADEDALRQALALPGVDWAYLRFVREDGAAWRPAAGTFPGWPTRAAEVTVCDPCCGSGHFLTEALVILTALRGREEGLDPAASACAVLRDNLHGLEIDGRCVQIAAFNVAITAWSLADGPVPLPPPHLAWVGAPPPMSRADMIALADGETALGRALGSLHDQFVQAPLLGSLMEVGARDLLDADLRERGSAVLALLREGEPERVEGAVAARGLIGATTLLTQRYTLMVTNVPFLGYREMGASLLSWIKDNHPRTKGDLGYCLWEQSLKFARPAGSVAIVSLQHWMSAISYRDFRHSLLSRHSLDMLLYLGTGAFETITGEKVNVTLTICSSKPVGNEHVMSAIDVGLYDGAPEKASAAQRAGISTISQVEQRMSPSHTISLVKRSITTTIGDYADCYAGVMNGDTPRFVAVFWEVPTVRPMWALLQSTTKSESFLGGFSSIIYYDEVKGHLREDARIRRDRLHNSDERGNRVWGKPGVAVNQMENMNVNLYLGNKFDSNVAVIAPKVEAHLSPILSFAASKDFVAAVRSIERKMNVTNATFNRVPFDLAHWQAVAAERYPNGFPEPYSDDPTQWLFHGHPAHAEPGTELHIALARLAGYRWPAETDADMRLAPLARERIAQLATLPPADPDGLLTLHPHGTGRSLADRLRAHLAAAYGVPLTPAREAELVAAADTRLDKKQARDATLEAWLRDRAFRQHCTLFHNRPFLWHVWDGLRDGFASILHYHRLDHALLQRLTYTHLGDWIVHTRDAGQAVQQERATRLQQDLARILAGEAPYDIFVRWKPLHRQPVGWAPDLDDGVRLNIRPFMEAGVLREQPRGIAWGKDRGTDVASAPWHHLGPQCGEAAGARINAHHLTLAEKQAARAQAAD